MIDNVAEPCTGNFGDVQDSEGRSIVLKALPLTGVPDADQVIVMGTPDGSWNDQAAEDFVSIISGFGEHQNGRYTLSLAGMQTFKDQLE
ncbi:hypothetical protein D3C78_1201030 [compost metagenome]